MSKTLSAHALDILHDLSRSPIPRCYVNAGVTERLYRDGFATEQELPTKAFKTKQTAMHVIITDRGRDYLKSLRSTVSDGSPLKAGMTEEAKTD